MAADGRTGRKGSALAIITISRGTFAGGQQLAELLSRRLDYRLISRELLYDTVHQHYGFTTEEVVKTMDHPPGSLHHVGEHRRRLLIAVQAALCDLVKDGEVVYHGQMGHLLLPQITHVLRIRLIAPRARRMELAMDRESIDRYQAGRRIDRVDAERSRWTQFVFGTNWADPSRYDMVLNLENMSVEEAADVVVAAASLPSFQPTEASRMQLSDLTVTARVRAKLMADPTTADLELKVEVLEGKVQLWGLADPVLGERVTAQISAVEDVLEVSTGNRRKKKR